MADSPLNIVNASGFAFQLAIEEAVRTSGERHDFQITSREHGWRDGTSPRFADLILTKGRIHLVIECKRTRGADWVFLVADPPTGRRAKLRRWFRTHYLRNEDSATGPLAVASLANFQLEPVSWESSFCSIRGSSEKDTPLLDRLCAELTRSADEIANQQLAIDGRRDPQSNQVVLNQGIWITIPVIVTTARLHVCLIDPATVPLADGEVPTDGARWETATHVRYRKSFDVPVSEQQADNIGALERQAQRSVVVVTAKHLVEWLEMFDLKRASYD